MMPGMAGIVQSLRGMHLILRDEGLGMLHRVVPEENFRALWSVPVPPGRDLQVDEAGAIVIGTGSGYEERDARTGGLLRAETGFPGTMTACRLEGGITLLSSIEHDAEAIEHDAEAIEHGAEAGDSEECSYREARAGDSGGGGLGLGLGPAEPAIVLRFVDKDGSVARTLRVPGYEYVRLVRLARHPSSGTLALTLTSNRFVLEVDLSGKVLSRFEISTALAEPHAWKAVKSISGGSAPGEFFVASGYQAELQVFDSEGRHIRSIRSPEETRPFFYCDFCELPGGNLLVVNWQGHGPDQGDKGEQLLVFSPGGGKYLGGWRPGKGLFSSIQAAATLAV